MTSETPEAAHYETATLRRDAALQNAGYDCPAGPEYDNAAAQGAEATYDTAIPSGPDTPGQSGLGDNAYGIAAEAPHEPAYDVAAADLAKDQGDFC